MGGRYRCGRTDPPAATGDDYCPSTFWFPSRLGIASETGSSNRPPPIFPTTVVRKHDSGRKNGRWIPEGERMSLAHDTQPQPLRERLDLRVDGCPHRPIE